MAFEKTRAERERAARIESVLADPESSGRDKRKAYDDLRDWMHEHPDQPGVELLRRYETEFGSPLLPAYPDEPPEGAAVEGGRLSSSHADVDRIRTEREARGEPPTDPALLQHAAWMGQAPGNTQLPPPADEHRPSGKPAADTDGGDAGGRGDR